MQYINLNKTLEFENDILDLLLISIDDQIQTSDDKEGIKIVGNILIGGKVNTINGEQQFNDKIDLDVFLTYDEIVDRNSLNISVSDFNYKVEENSLIINVSLKMDGLKEIETIFLSEEDNELVQKEEIVQEDEEIEEKEEGETEEIEINEDKKVYIDLDIGMHERKSKMDDIGKINENIDFFGEESEEDIGDKDLEENYDNSANYEPKKKSLLKSIFSNKKINEEVFWKLHCVKNEKSYEEIAQKYNVNLKKLIDINNNEKIEEGKLVFLPLE